MKLISTRYSRPEELSSAYPAEVAAELVRNALEYRENIDGLDQLRMDGFVNSESEVIERVTNGEWLLVKDEAYMFDWSVFAKKVRADKLEPLMLEMMRNPPVQEKPKIKYGRIFRVINSETTEFLAFRPFYVTIDGVEALGKTDVDGIARVYSVSDNLSLSIRLIYQSPVRELREVHNGDAAHHQSIIHARSCVLTDDTLPIEIAIDDRAMTREIILQKLRVSEFLFTERSSWGAVKDMSLLTMDWDYFMIALHHAGRTFTCGNFGALQMNRILSEHLLKFGEVGYHYGIDCAGHIFEGRDIRLKGGSVDGYNSRVIGIVLLEDLTTPAEVGDWVDFAKSHMRDWGYATEDKVPVQQVAALNLLLDAIQSVFAIEVFAGHREYPKQAKEGKVCPGNGGLELVKNIRNSRGLGIP